MIFLAALFCNSFRAEDVDSICRTIQAFLDMVKDTNELFFTRVHLVTKITRDIMFKILEFAAGATHNIDIKVSALDITKLKKSCVLFFQGASQSPKGSYLDHYRVAKQVIIQEQQVFLSCKQA